MPTLLACLSTGKGTWSEVTKLMQAQPWTAVYLLTNQFGKDNFTVPPGNVELLVLNSDADSVEMLVDQIKKQLQGKISDFEVALNIVSGSGKEHMALLEAVLEMGLNFRLVTVVHNQMEVLGLKR